MQMILNELSSKFPCESVEEGRTIMKTFVDTYYTVKHIIDNDSILLDQSYQSMELAHGYRIEKWRNDSEVDVELKRKFRSLLNKSAVYHLREFDDKESLFLTSEFRCENENSQGCLLVYETGGLAISFCTDILWEADMINGEYIYLSENGDLYFERASIPNVSNDENVKVFKTRYQRDIESWGNTKIKSGQDILNLQNTIFKNLIFCDNALYQLRLKIGIAEAPQVYKKLLELQHAAECLTEGFDKNVLKKATPESAETLKQFKEEHTIKLPNGKRQLFSWHIRFTGSYAGRIFFEPVPGQKKIFVGYIGKKLPTVKYPTV